MLRSMTSPDTPAQQILKSLDRDVRHSRPNQANSAHLAGLALQIFILLTLVVMPVAAQKATPKAKSKVGQKAATKTVPKTEQKPAPGQPAETPPATEAPEPPEVTDFGSRPIFLNVNVFQLEVDAASDPDVTDQVFRMKSGGLQDHERWMRAFSKTYPGQKVSVLKLETRKAFRTAKPTIVQISRQNDGRAMILELNAAQSPGDGVTPGTSLVAILNLQFGNDQAIKPVTYSITPLEVEHGMTYFYLIRQVRLNSTEYVRFLRPNEQPEKFANKNFYLIVSISVELDQAVTPPRYYDERQSLKLQEEATRKVPLALSAEKLNSGLKGMVRVKVDVGADGKVTRANVVYSTIPEANEEAIAAARQWEFPASLFESDKNPVTCFISFNVPPK
jgi:TonB family protein